jgi:hypothetical protein
VGVDDHPPFQAFATLADRDAALVKCTAAVDDRCVRGARYGCALAAARKCALPVWQRLLGRRGNPSQRAMCEAAHRAACGQGAAKACAGHAAGFCRRAVGVGDGETAASLAPA